MGKNEASLRVCAGFGTMSFIVVFILFLTYILSGMDAFIQK
jgi:hypothetical protein